MITFLSFLFEAAYAHSTGTADVSIDNDHEHGRIISASELFLSITSFTAGLAIGMALLFRKRR
jgi:hypothetical protein